MVIRTNKMHYEWEEFEDILKTSVNRMFKECLDFSEIAEMNEESIVCMNETIRLYRGCKEFFDKIFEIYDRDITDIEAELNDVKEQNSKILAKLDTIREAQRNATIEEIMAQTKM